ncbi:MAG: hypothetical protein J6O04_09685 [Selenomonadaceae bacterium]|nr:hypothetical protein [Selenomonadaceae bacterium]
MGTLSKKLFKKTRSVPVDKAKKIGVEAFKKQRVHDVNKAYAEIGTLILLLLHNDFGFGKTRLARVLSAMDDLMRGIKKYDGDPVAEARKILVDECGFNIVEEYAKLMKGGIFENVACETDAS